MWAKKQTPTFYQTKIRSTQTGTQKRENPTTTAITSRIAAMWVKLLPKK